MAQNMLAMINLGDIGGPLLAMVIFAITGIAADGAWIQGFRLDHAQDRHSEGTG